MEKRQKIFNATDYSKFVDCNDTTGEHQFLDAEFPGGHQIMKLYIAESITYPENSIEMAEEGKVYMSFVIEVDGRLTDIRVEKGISQHLDREAKRCIREMPLWIPGQCNGITVRTRAFLPIVFLLE